MELGGLFEKIDELIAFEPRWFSWAEMDQQIL